MYALKTWSGLIPVCYDLVKLYIVNIEAVFQLLLLRCYLLGYRILSGLNLVLRDDITFLHALVHFHLLVCRGAYSRQVWDIFCEIGHLHRWSGNREIVAGFVDWQNSRKIVYIVLSRYVPIEIFSRYDEALRIRLIKPQPRIRHFYPFHRLNFWLLRFLHGDVMGLVGVERHVALTNVTHVILIIFGGIIHLSWVLIGFGDGFANGEGVEGLILGLI